MYNCAINYHQLLDALKRIQSVQLKTKKKRQNYLLELYFKQNELEVGAVGIAITIESKSSFYKKLFVPFLSFQKLIDGLKNDWIEIEFDDSYVQLENRRIESHFIKVEHPENQRRHNLSINYSNIELLSLRNQFSISELEMNNLLHDLEKAEAELHDNINTTVSILKGYGITYEEIKFLINKKIEAIQKINKN